MAASGEKRFSVLVINPNTSTHMTEGLKPIVDGLGFADVQFDYFTAPSEKSVTLPDGRVVQGIVSINSGDESALSSLHCWPFVEPLIPQYDAFLVACYSAHPLVSMLKQKITKLEDAAFASGNSQATKKYVTGIFEASVVASLSLISSFQLTGDGSLHKSQVNETFGIVTTGTIWEEELIKAVREMLVQPGDGTASTGRFAGVGTTGLTAVELHTTPADEVKRRIIEATERLIKSNPHPVGAICMGCAGMAGMEEAVREGCVKAYGPQRGNRVSIVDGVVAGVGMLVTACKARF